MNYPTGSAELAVQNTLKLKYVHNSGLLVKGTMKSSVTTLTTDQLNMFPWSLLQKLALSWQAKPSAKHFI